MTTNYRTRNVPGLGSLRLRPGARYVAGRTIVDKKRLPHPVVVIVSLDEKDNNITLPMGGPNARRDAIKAVIEFNRIMDMRDGRW